MSTLDEMREAVINGDPQGVEGFVRNALEEGVSADVILNLAMISAMDEVGELFEQGTLFIPEMLIAARAMQAGMRILQPLLAESGIAPLGRIAIGTVKGDLHDIGKNLVGMMLEGAGFEVVDLGVDVEAKRFIRAVQEGVNLIGLSALLTTTMTSMETVILKLEEAGLREHTKVMVGGAPVTLKFAESIGADGYAPDASQAVKVAKGLFERDLPPIVALDSTTKCNSEE
ncbi:MAG: corrinoid protein [Anaerolineales bacterium]|nr:corrinoid protein [Anaerolineales bacterium]